jgi:predicted nucleotidyltransferase
MKMSSKPKILRFLMDNKQEAFSINSVSRRLKINYRIAFEDMKKLEADGLILIKKLGNSNQCQFSNHFNEETLKIEEEKKAELLKDKNLKVLYKRISEIKNPFFVCLIFGSYARGEQTKQSDVDLCIITDNQEVKERVGKTLRTLPLEIHLLGFTTDEFISMLKTNEQNVGKEIITSYIILKGTESFYELINYA